MKLWIDDVRPAPEGYVWCKSVNEAKHFIEDHEETCGWVFARSFKAFMNDMDDDTWKELRDEANAMMISLIDIDHDAGEYAKDGGDYIELLDWLEETKRNDYPIHIHSMNPVGIQNMRAIIERNGWKEV
jgi:hypothetical protein